MFFPLNTHWYFNRWKVISASDSLDNDEQLPFKPTGDHTYDSTTGYFVFTSATKGDYEDSTDLITSLPVGKLNL